MVTGHHSFMWRMYIITTWGVLRCLAFQASNWNVAEQHSVASICPPALVTSVLSVSILLDAVTQGVTPAAVDFQVHTLSGFQGHPATLTTRGNARSLPQGATPSLHLQNAQVRALFFLIQETLHQMDQVKKVDFHKPSMSMRPGLCEYLHENKSNDKVTRKLSTFAQHEHTFLQKYEPVCSFTTNSAASRCCFIYMLCKRNTWQCRRSILFGGKPIITAAVSWSLNAWIDSIQKAWIDSVQK